MGNPHENPADQAEPRLAGIIGISIRRYQLSVGFCCRIDQTADACDVTQVRHFIVRDQALIRHERSSTGGNGSRDFILWRYHVCFVLSVSGPNIPAS
jgi:hypothetical protein